MNFAQDIFDQRPPQQLALVEIRADGERVDWDFARIAKESGSMAARLHQHGVRAGDTVVTLIGNRPEWVATMMACFWTGAVALPCTEQLQASDLRFRFEATDPRLVVADTRNRAALDEVGLSCPVVWVDETGVVDETLAGDAPPFAELGADDPCLITFTSGTAGKPKAVLHVQRYLTGQSLQAEHWIGCATGELLWCTAATGWSKSARNVFIAPWLRGTAALLHDGRFDPEQRLALIAEHGVNVLCMAPTEYRVIARRATLRELPGLRSCIAAGEALEASTIEAWREGAGVEIRDGYGQTETGQITSQRPDTPVRAGSMGLPLPGIDAWVQDGELVVRPSTVPTFFGRYLDDAPIDLTQPWHTGDRVRADEDGYLWFESRTDDIIISSGYRIGPFEVESALLSHPAVAEVAVIGVPDHERGAIVQAVVVAKPDHAPADAAQEQALIADLQAHAKAATAPYKYPRSIEFVSGLPKTSSGKIQRALLREARS